MEARRSPAPHSEAAAVMMDRVHMGIRTLAERERERERQGWLKYYTWAWGPVPPSCAGGGEGG